MDRYNLKIVGKNVIAIKGTLLYTGVVTGFRADVGGITDIEFMEQAPFETKHTAKHDEVFTDPEEACKLRIKRCEYEIERLGHEVNLVKQYLDISKEKIKKIKKGNK